jgi:hypothetical protein
MKNKILIITHKIKNKIANTKYLYAGNDYLIAELLRKKFIVKIHQYSLINSFDDLNKEIISITKKIKPNIIFFFDLESKPFLTTNTIQYLSNNFYLVNMCMDADMFISNNNFYNKYMDYVLTNSPNTLRPLIKKKSQFFDIGSYKSKKKKIRKKYDVVFLGTANKSNRKDYILFLKQRKIKVYDFGPDSSRGVVSPNKYYNIINSSKICLRFSSRNFKKDLPILRQDPLSVNRKFQHVGFLDYLSCGAFLLVEQMETLNIFINNNCFKFFKNKEDLFSKINFYLKNKEERKKIAQNGYNIFKKFYQNQILTKLFKNLSNTNKLKNNISFNLKDFCLFRYNQNNFLISTMRLKNINSKIKDIFFILKFPYFKYFFIMKLIIKKILKI